MCMGVPGVPRHKKMSQKQQSFLICVAFLKFEYLSRVDFLFEMVRKVISLVCFLRKNNVLYSSVFNKGYF